MIYNCRSSATYSESLYITNYICFIRDRNSVLLTDKPSVCINRFSLDCPYGATETGLPTKQGGLSFVSLLKSSTAWINRDSEIRAQKEEAALVSQLVYNSIKVSRALQETDGVSNSIEVYIQALRDVKQLRRSGTRYLIH